MGSITSSWIESKRIVVVGGAGFIGSHLCDKILANRPESLAIVDNFSLGKVSNIRQFRSERMVRVYRCDAAEYDSVKSVLRRESPDAVFNLAVIPLPKSLEFPFETIDTNIRITANLCELLRKDFFTALLQCSSSEAYGTALYVPMDENHPEKPITPYAASKVSCDHIAISYYRTFGLDISIARPFNTYGPRQNEKTYAGVIPRTIRRIMLGKNPEIFGSGLQTRDYSYVTDIAEGIISVAGCKDARGRVVNLASGIELTIRYIIETISILMKHKGGITFRAPRPGDVQRHLGDNSLAKKLFGYSQKVNHEEGLRQTILWYQNEMRW